MIWQLFKFHTNPAYMSHYVKTRCRLQGPDLQKNVRTNLGKTYDKVWRRTEPLRTGNKYTKRGHVVVEICDIQTYIMTVTQTRWLQYFHDRSNNSN